MKLVKVQCKTDFLSILDRVSGNKDTLQLSVNVLIKKMREKKLTPEEKEILKKRVSLTVSSLRAIEKQLDSSVILEK